jgi:hypothetical protein
MGETPINFDIPPQTGNYGEARKHPHAMKPLKLKFAFARVRVGLTAGEEFVKTKLIIPRLAAWSTKLALIPKWFDCFMLHMPIP